MGPILGDKLIGPHWGPAGPNVGGEVICRLDVTNAITGHEPYCKKVVRTKEQRDRQKDI